MIIFTLSWIIVIQVSWDSYLRAWAEELRVRVILLLYLNRMNQHQFACNISFFILQKREKCLGNVSKLVCWGEMNSGSGTKKPNLESRICHLCSV